MRSAGNAGAFAPAVRTAKDRAGRMPFVNPTTPRHMTNGGHNIPQKSGGFLKRTVLAAQTAERADIGDRKRKQKLVFVARAEVETAELETDAATIGVVDRLYGCEFQNPFWHIVVNAEAGIPAFPVVVADADCSAQLIRAGRQHRVAANLAASERDEVI